MRKLLPFLLLAAPLASAQTTVPIQNPSFEQSAPVNDWNNGPVPGWNCTGSGGLWQPLSRGYYATVPDGATVLWKGSGPCSQDTGLPVAANRIYKLTVPVGHRKDGYDNSYTLSLSAGTTVLCTKTGSNALITLGGWAPQELPCTIGDVAPAGNLVVTLSAAGSQVAFDNVTLSYVSTTPTTFYNFTLSPGRLRFCNLCNGTDDSTTGLSVLEGTVLQIYQGTVSAASFTANSTGDIGGPIPVDVSQDPLVFNVVLLSPAGSLLCPTSISGGIQPVPLGTCFQTAIDSATLGKWHLVNNVNMFTPDFTSIGFILRLDARTGAKRGAEQWVSP